ncbi:MAG: hypothetical protein ACI4LZ_01460 [Anaerovoracaceae bacterium]
MKKFIALLLTVAMVLSLGISAFATDSDKPTSSVSVSSITGISSVTVEGTTAYYEKDSNTGTGVSGKVYIRALVSNSTEYDLKNAEVVITTTETAPSVYTVNASGNNDTLVNYSSSDGNAYTYSLNLLNVKYNVVVGNKTYVLAAGLPDGAVSISNSDPLRITSLSVAGVSCTITAENVQNPFMGNPYYSGWTYVSHTATATINGTINDRATASASLNIPSGTSAPVANSCISSAVTGNGSAQSCTLNLSAASPKLVISSGNDSRNYYLIISDNSTVTLTFGFDFTEAKGSTYYTGDVKDAVDTLVTQAAVAYGNGTGKTYGTVVVTAGTTAMDLMIEFADIYEYSDEVPEGCTYMATLNGIGEFTFGNMSGWMYTNTAVWDDDGNAIPTSWNTPPVGGANYVLSDGEAVIWFICCDYTHHPWS